MIRKIKTLTLKTIYVVTSIFYIITNGIVAYLSVKGLQNFVPKLIEYYKTGDEKFAFYLILTIIAIISLKIAIIPTKK